MDIQKFKTHPKALLFLANKLSMMDIDLVEVEIISEEDAEFKVKINYEDTKLDKTRAAQLLVGMTKKIRCNEILKDVEEGNYVYQDNDLDYIYEWLSNNVKGLLIEEHLNDWYNKVAKPTIEHFHWEEKDTLEEFYRKNSHYID